MQHLGSRHAAPRIEACSTSSRVKGASGTRQPRANVNIPAPWRLLEACTTDIPDSCLEARILPSSRVRSLGPRHVTIAENIG